MKRLLLLFIGAQLALTTLARDFEYTYEGQTLTYSIISEALKNCRVVPGSNTAGLTGDITIPDQIQDGEKTYKVTHIGKKAFYQCSNLTSVTMPATITTIEDHAFEGCTAMTRADIPAAVTKIGYCAFSYCSSLVSATLPEHLTIIENCTFEGCSSLESIVIPPNVTEIGSCAFMYCSKLNSVTLPASIAEMGEFIFYKCGSLKSVYYNCEEPLERSYDNFLDCPEDATLYVPASAVEKCKLIEPWYMFKNIEAFDFNDIKEINADGHDANEPCEIYTLSGIKTGTSMSGLTPGIYIVRQGKDKQKVIVK
ncbi:MAG: leucine-rich repeat domain-containing protein [Muribaculaceae bacterium]|nr:leucine-rich repeat domain-containing protein [Muribaculaceae bacterium]